MALGRQPADFDFMLKDAGVPVEHTDEDGVIWCGHGTIEDMDVDTVGVEEGSLAAHQKVLTVSREHFPKLAAGGRLRVDGVDCYVTQVREASDGLPLRVWCVRSE